MVLYLLLADLENTVLSAILAFSDRLLYPSYAGAPRLFGLSPMEDQVAAGAFMWVAGSLAFIVPAIALTIQCLSTRTLEHSPGQRTPRYSPPLKTPRTLRLLRKYLCVLSVLCGGMLLSIPSATPARNAMSAW